MTYVASVCPKKYFHVSFHQGRVVLMNASINELQVIDI